MRSIIRPVGLLATVLMVFGPSPTRSDDAPKADPKQAEVAVLASPQSPQVPRVPKVDPNQAEAVDRVLGEWHKRASKMTSLEVLFRTTTPPNTFDPTKKGQGHLIVALPNLAMFDVAELDEKGKPTIGRERRVWSGRTTFRFETEKRTASRIDYQEQSSPPPYLCLPFLFGMSVDQAKRDHEWKIVREDESRVFLKATPKKPDQSIFDLMSTKGSWLRETFIVELDKKTYLPKYVFFPHDSNAREYTTYELANIKVNLIIDIESLKNPNIEGWKFKN